MSVTAELICWMGVGMPVAVTETCAVTVAISSMTLLGDDVGAAAVEVVADAGSECGGGGEQEETSGLGAADLVGAGGSVMETAMTCLPWMSWTLAPTTTAPSGSVTVPRTMTAWAAVVAGRGEERAEARSSAEREDFDERVDAWSGEETCSRKDAARRRSGVNMNEAPPFPPRERG